MPSPDPVRVEILRVIATERTSPEAIVQFEVRNQANGPVWLVDDGWLCWHQVNRAIELRLQRVRMRPGVQVFGYFFPELVLIPPGERLVRDVHLVWPQPLDTLWNLRQLAAPRPGSYLVSVRIGYGLSPRPDDPVLGESVEGPVLRWQHEALSGAVGLDVPDYEGQPGGTP